MMGRINGLPAKGAVVATTVPHEEQNRAPAGKLVPQR
jgi:hypothetical protein